MSQAEKENKYTIDLDKIRLDLAIKDEDTNVYIARLNEKQFEKFIKMFEEEWFKSVPKERKIMELYDFEISYQFAENSSYAVILPKQAGAFKAVKVPIVEKFGNYLEIPRAAELRKRARTAAWRIFLYEGEPFPEEKEILAKEEKYIREIDPTSNISLEKLLEAQEWRTEQIAKEEYKKWPPFDYWFNEKSLSTSVVLHVTFPMKGDATIDYIDRNGDKLLILSTKELRKRVRDAYYEIFYKQTVAMPRQA